jgi:hypothetical protein
MGIDGNAAVSVDRHNHGRMYGKSKTGPCLAISKEGIILDNQEQKMPTNVTSDSALKLAFVARIKRTGQRSATPLICYGRYINISPRTIRYSFSAWNLIYTIIITVAKY